MKKLLTISVAAHNAAFTLEECLGSMCLDEQYMDELEVIVTDDGSTDQTPQIIQGFMEKRPGTFRLISQENKGYGSSLENALTEGEGLFFKVVDGDDKVNPQGLKKLLDRIKELDGCRENTPDLIVTPFFTWRSKCTIGEKHYTEEQYTLVENHRRIPFDLAYLQESDLSSGLSIFEITCRRSLLLKACPRFLHHCFYVDNQLVMAVLLAADTICGLDHPVTVYRTDRPGQSMSQDSLSVHFKDTIMVGSQVYSMYRNSSEKISGGKMDAAELLISSMARLEWLAGLLSSQPLCCRSTLRKRYRALNTESPEIFQMTRRSRIARAGMQAGPLGFLVMSASFKIKNRISHSGQVLYFAKKHRDKTE